MFCFKHETAVLSVKWGNFKLKNNSDHFQNAQTNLHKTFISKGNWNKKILLLMLPSLVTKRLETKLKQAGRANPCPNLCKIRTISFCEITSLKQFEIKHFVFPCIVVVRKDLEIKLCCALLRHYCNVSGEFSVFFS